jgi:predicted small secreted protein
LRKARAQQVEWSHRYTVSAVASLILCIIVTALVFPMFTVPEDFFLHVLLSAFAFGFGVDGAFIETAEWVFPKRTEG